MKVQKKIFFQTRRGPGWDREQGIIELHYTNCASAKVGSKGLLIICKRFLFDALFYIFPVHGSPFT